MGVAPPKGGDCIQLVAGCLFLFRCFLLSQEAEDATPSPEPSSPGVDSTCTKAGEDPPKMTGPQPRELQHQAANPQPPQAPKPGWCPAWHQTALEPPKVPAPPTPTLPATKPWWGPTPSRTGLNPLRAPNPPMPCAAALSRQTAALTSSKHCCGSTTAAALASPDGATPVGATAGTADTVMAGCEGRSGHSLKRCPFWWQL